VEELAYRFEAKVIFLQVVEPPDLVLVHQEDHGVNMEIYEKKHALNENRHVSF